MTMKFADRTVTYRQFVDDLARKVANLVGRRVIDLMKENPDMVTTDEAAKILGITPSYLRRIKDRFPHVKSGDNKQGKLLFVRNALVKEYSKGEEDEH